MQTILKNTKIVSTSGPAITRDVHPDLDFANKQNQEMYQEVLGIFENLFLDGVNCVRFNFSHAVNDERIFRLKLINETLDLILKKSTNYLTSVNNSSLQFVRPVVNMCDTKGPEIRVYQIENSKGQVYKAGQIITIHCIEKIKGDEHGFSVTDSTGEYNMANDCVVGKKILIDDGKLSLTIIETEKNKGIVKVLIDNNHILKSNKRINLPGANYSMPFLSQKDIVDIKFAFDNNFTIFALSFVNKAKDVLDVKDILKKHRSDVKLPELFSKIETQQSLDNIDEIIDVSDGIMIARGDLGLEIPYYEVPYWTKQIIKKCAIKKKPVIVATQMLDSIEKNIIPTRAEVTDVYRAAELGSDSTMLSGETAQGLFPNLAVQIMSNILIESEKRSNYEKFINYFKLHSFSGKIIKTVVELYELIIKNRENLLGAFCFDSATSDDLLLAISCAKLPILTTVFTKIKSLHDGLKQENLMNFSLHRGIQKIGVINLREESLETCVIDYLHSYNYKFSENFAGKKVILYVENKLIIKIL